CQDRRQRQPSASVVQLFEEREIGITGFVDQVEFHQIPGRPVGQGGRAFRADRDARGYQKRNRGTAVSETNKAMNDQFPDRLSVNPDSPYYNAEILARDVGIRFK